MKKKSTVTLRSLLYPSIPLALLTLACLSPQRASAGTVHSVAYLEKNGDEETDSLGDDQKNIESELEKTGSVKLVKGETYYVGRIMLQNGWKIDATGATIYCTGQLFDHEWSKVNYGSLKNITVTGGKWLHTQSKGYTNTLILC